MRRSPIMSPSGVALQVVVLALIVLAGPVSPLSADEIVDHPDKLLFEDLDYDPPMPEAYRHILECGATAYIAEMVAMIGAIVFGRRAVALVAEGDEVEP